MSLRENAFNDTTKMQPNTSQKRIPQKGKGRKFFQHMQPTFAVDVPTSATKLQFLDENDPAKDTIVRKKAREWVNMNRDLSNQNRQKLGGPKTKHATPKDKDEEDEAMQLQRRKSNDMTVALEALQGIGSRQFDSFNILPDVGRKYGHIIEFCGSISRFPII
jgi:hypothetical protein